MKVAIIFTALFVSACGPVYQYKALCDKDGKNCCINNIWSYIPLNQDNIDHNLAAAETAMEHGGMSMFPDPVARTMGTQMRPLVKSMVEFCGLFRTTDIMVRSVDAWTCPNGVYCSGWQLNSSIEVQRSGNFLVHELLHRYDLITYGVSHGGHYDWEYNGYYYMEDQYENYSVAFN